MAECGVLHALIDITDKTEQFVMVDGHWMGGLRTLLSSSFGTQSFILISLAKLPIIFYKTAVVDC